MIPDCLHKHITLCFGLLASSLLAAQPEFRNPVVINEEDGLPSNYISCMVQGPEGFLWLGTDMGLCRFDGQEIRVYKAEEGQAGTLADNEVRSLLADSRGQIWVGTESGLSVLERGKERFHNYRAGPENKDFIPEGRISSLFEDQEEYIWIGNQGLVRYSHCTGQFEAFHLRGDPAGGIDTSRLNAIIDISQDPANDSILWLATLAGLVRFNRHSQEHTHLTAIMQDKDLQYSFNSMRKVYAHPDGKVYTGSWGGAGVYDPETGKISRIRFPAEEGQASFDRRMAVSLLNIGRDKLWITYSTGLAEYDTRSGKVERIRRNDLQKGLVYGGEWIDQAGRLWVMSEQGLYLYNPLRTQVGYHYFPVSNESLFNLPSGVVESPDGRYLYLSVIQGDGIYIFDRQEQEWETVRAPERFYDNEGGFSSQGIFRLQNGKVLVLGEENLFYFLEEERRLQPIAIDFPVEAPFFRTAVEGKAGEIWIGSRRRGLFRAGLDTREVRHYQEEMSHNGYGRSSWIEQLFRDSRGNLWIRAASGYSLYLADKDTILNFPCTVNGQPMANSFVDVRGFSEDREGRIWIAGADEGIGVANPAEIEKGIARKYKGQDILKCSSVRSLTRDREGNFWLNSEKGLVLFDPYRLHFQLFGEGYGIPVKNANSFKLLNTGEIVIGLRKGICLFYPGSLRANLERPRPYLSSFKVFDEEFSKDTSLLALREVRLSYRQNFFSFEFGSIGYDLPEQHKFAYQLVGVDEGWVYAGKRRYASYTNIPGGNYTFRVKAANNEGLWSESPYELDIFITTPWWKAWWFWLALGSFILLDTFLFVRWRINQVRRKESMKAEFDRKLANVELNALRAQMNPHFIFNCLNSIDYYILKNDTDTASDYLNRFSRLIRLILQNSRSEYVNLKDELESLKLYIEMESLRFEQQFDYEVKVGRGLRMEEVEIPPMLLQPYVENAIWHGLMQKEGKGRLDLIITQQNGHLNCIIEDNGIGREAAKKLRSKTATRRKSMGMRITQDRISMINRLYKTNASVEVTDLKDEQGNAQGTRVELNIPF